MTRLARGSSYGTRLSAPLIHIHGKFYVLSRTVSSVKRWIKPPSWNPFMTKILRWNFAVFISLLSTVAIADPLLGRWICSSPAGQDMVEVTPETVAFVSLLQGATVYPRGPSGSDKLILQTSPPTTLAASRQATNLKLVSTTLKIDLACTQLSESSSATFVPLRNPNGGSLLDMDVLIAKSFLESDQVKKNIKGQYTLDRMNVCIADPALPQSLWGETRPVPRLSTLMEHSFLFWGAPLPAKDRPSSRGSEDLIDSNSPWQGAFRRWLVEKNILVKNIFMHYCEPRSLSSYVVITPKVLGLPMKQINQYIFEDDFNDLVEAFKNLEQYQLQNFGEIKINDIGISITKTYAERDNAEGELRRQQAALESQIKGRLAQGSDDIVSALIRKKVSGSAPNDTENATLCLVQLKVKKQAVDGMNYEPAFAKWAARNERIRFEKITKTPDEMFEAISRGECQKVVGHASAMTQIIDAAKRDKFAVSVYAITPELSFLNAYAKNLKLENFAEWETATSMNASPGQYLQLKKMGLGQADDFKRALLQADVVAHLKVTGKTTDNASVADYLSYNDDLEQGKKSGKSAAVYRTEANRRLEIERQEAADLAARRDLARSKVNLNLSLICYGEDYNAGNDLRNILDMYASNTNIMSITSYMQNSQTCSMRSASQVHRANQFSEYLRRGNLVGIRSKANAPGVGYLYSFTHRENWDVSP